jgi:uncharacterized protein (UPF0261 family)
MPTVAILGTYDSKGAELAFVADQLRSLGLDTLRIDVGSLEAPVVPVDISRDTVLAALPGDARATLERRDRGECVALMARAAAAFVGKLASEGRLQGIISVGGGGGTAIGTAAMRALPIGLPKVMVSTLASGQTAPYVGTSDIVMIPAIVDVAGLNRISRTIFENAAGALQGMVAAAEARRGRTAIDRPIVVASMFGNTTACVTEARRLVEAAGYEVLVFHATGTGGRAMEALIESGLVAGVLDITTTEWADELVGGILSAGPTRLEAAGRLGVPTIVTPGCLDMVNFGEPATVPGRFAGRTFYPHNPQVTLLRTNAEECTRLGEVIAGKLNAYRGPVALLLPRGGISVISAPGQPFHAPDADAALFTALRRHLRPEIPVIESPAAINDPAFARLCAETLLAFLATAPGNAR